MPQDLRQPLIKPARRKRSTPLPALTAPHLTRGYAPPPAHRINASRRPTPSICRKNGHIYRTFVRITTIIIAVTKITTTCDGGQAPQVRVRIPRSPHPLRALRGPPS